MSKQSIFQTSGAFTTEQLSKGLNKYDFIDGLELSSGDFLKDINIILDSNKCLSLSVHNYFPVPKESIVLNLASNNPVNTKNSLEFMKRAIDIAKYVGSDVYSFHAGFLIDPHPNELGKLNYSQMIDRSIGLDNFVKNVSSLSQYARSQGIKLMIENNVCSQRTVKKFGCSPLLFVTETDVLDIKDQLDENVFFLCDMAHLNVSSNILGFSKDKFLKEVDDKLYGYHLSSNDGFEDTNNCFDDSEWFFDYLNPHLNYYTVEVYDDNYDNLNKSHNALKNYLIRN